MVCIYSIHFYIINLNYTQEITNLNIISKTTKIFNSFFFISIYIKEIPKFTGKKIPNSILVHIQVLAKKRKFQVIFVFPFTQFYSKVKIREPNKINNSSLCMNENERLRKEFMHLHIPSFQYLLSKMLKYRTINLRHAGESRKYMKTFIIIIIILFS